MNLNSCLKKSIMLVIATSIMILMFLINMQISFAAQFPTQEVYVTVNKQLKITHNNIVKQFYDGNGNVVYPLSYNDTTYLPIRAISSLFNEPIEWNDIYKVIMVGDGYVDYSSVRNIHAFYPGVNETVKVLIDPNLRIAYKDSLQSFKDANGNVVYPISYNNTTYLPIRAISNMFGTSIYWDGNTNSINITGNIIRYFIADEKEDDDDEDEDDDEDIIEDFNYEYGVFLGIDSFSTLKKRARKYYKIVIDADNFNDKQIEELINQGHCVYSYLNIGSLENFRYYYNQFSGITLGPYENWDDEEWIDVSDTEWQEFIIDLAEEYVDIGIEGFYVDNCDVYYNYQTDAIYNGLVKILTELRDVGAEVMVNGGDTFVTRYMEENKKLKNILTEINQETVFTKINWDTKTFSAADDDSESYFLSYLNDVDDHKVDIYLLEYTTKNSLEELIEDYCREHDWYYYIASSIELD